MNVQFFFVEIGRRVAIAALIAAGALLVSALPVSAAWQHAHGDSTNSGFAMVDTAPAWWASMQQPLGSIAPGANPVAGPNGDVNIGNLQGELRAFHADGTPYWTRKINSLQGGFFAAPVVGADGSIYAVSSIHYRDHRDGETKQVYESYLHKFSPGGAWMFWKPFPSSDIYPFVGTGTTTAPPNIWRWNGTEAIIVPVVTKGLGGENLRLVAFSATGAVLADKLVTHTGYDITSSMDPSWLAACLALNWWNGELVCAVIWYATGAGEFQSNGDYVPLGGAGFPLPGVAIRPDPQGGAPVVMATDGKHDKIAYSFSPQTGFSQVARSSHLLRTFTTPPVVLPNGDTLTGTLDGYMTRNFSQFGASGLGTLTAAPTRLSNGGLVIVNREGWMTATGNGVHRHTLSGESIASAAASCNHIFAASTYEFATFDAKTLGKVTSMPWTGGGLHSPVIGPSGHVYAIAANTLYVFPRPWKPIWDTRPPSCFLLPPVLTQ